MIRVVVDTNVIVSALLKAGSDPALIVSLILGEEITLCLSEEIWKEYGGVLARNKFARLDRASVAEFLDRLKASALWVEPRIKVNRIKEDPADNAFLECALAAEAHFFITGNRKHFSFPKFRKCRIVSPREMLILLVGTF